MFHANKSLGVDVRKLASDMGYNTEQHGDAVTDVTLTGISGPEPVNDTRVRSLVASGQALTSDENSADSQAAMLSKLPAFTAGTLIATPAGERPVETLQRGCRIQTRDNGIQTVIWTGKTSIGKPAPGLKPVMRPVKISAGALGAGLPEKDMLVAPAHRFLLMTEISELYFGESEVLVEAGHLTLRKGIRSIDPAAVTYVNIMFENHELVLANGVWTESFQPTSKSVKALDPDQKAALFAAVPALGVAETANSYRAARKSLKRHEAALLLN